MLTDSTLPSHYTMIRQIRDTLLEWSPATFIGFNSMSFDENLLRQALFQTLHPAYLTNTNGNARSDVLRVAHAASVYTPDAMVVPTDDRGRQVFRLDRLALANGHTHADAHEAMADVMATIYMARLIRNRAPQIWKIMDRAAIKNAVKDYVATESIFSLTESYYGRIYSWLVTSCGQHPKDAGQLSVFDLSFDPDGYRFLSTEDLALALNTGPKVIRSPTGQPATNYDAGRRRGRLVQRRFSFHRVNADAVWRLFRTILILRYGLVGLRHSALRTRIPPAHVEQRIYEGFPNAADVALMEQFHQAGWAMRSALAAQIGDPRIVEFSKRLIYFKRPDLLPKAQSAEINAWMADRLLTEDESVPWMTIKKALRETDHLLQGVSGEEAHLLNEVKDFLYDRAEQVASSW